MNFKGAFHAFMSKNKNLAKVANLSYQMSSFKSSFMLSVPQVISCFKLQQEVFLKEGSDRHKKLTESHPAQSFGTNRELGENAESLPSSRRSMNQEGRAQIRH